MKRLLFGVLAVLAGILLLGFNLGLLPLEFKHIIFSWQMLLIALGVINIVSKDSWMAGAILISIGGFFILPKLSIFPFSLDAIIVPGILITIGSIVIIKRAFFPNYRRDWRNQWEQKKKYDHLESGYIDETNIFGGSKRIISPSEFKGGKVTNIFGGSEINLTQTTLSEGKNVLDVTCMFGGVKIIVPSDWKVFVKVDAIMGGFDDKRMNIKADHDSTKELYIKGLALFGGGELKSY